YVDVVIACIERGRDGVADDCVVAARGWRFAEVAPAGGRVQQDQLAAAYHHRLWEVRPFEAAGHEALDERGVGSVIAVLRTDEHRAAPGEAQPAGREDDVLRGDDEADTPVAGDQACRVIRLAGASVAGPNGAVC